MFSLWYSIVASQLLYIRLHECCKQLKRPVAVIPQCSYPETLSLETAGMSSFSLSLSFFFFLLQTFSLVGFTPFLYVFFTFFLSVLGMCKQSPTALSAFPAVPFLACTLMRSGREQTRALCTQTWQSVTDTEASANNGSDACGKMRKHRGVVRRPPLFAPSCSLTYTLAHI